MTALIKKIARLSYLQTNCTSNLDILTAFLRKSGKTTLNVILDIATAPLYNESEQKGKETLRGTPAVFLPAEKSFFSTQKTAHACDVRERNVLRTISPIRTFSARGAGSDILRHSVVAPAEALALKIFICLICRRKTAGFFEALSPLRESKYIFLGGSK